MTQGNISHLQRLSTHDGNGIRSTLFLKGCNLHCPWCHNPEAISRNAILGHNPSPCISCASCLSACKHKALVLTDAGTIDIDREKCTNCFSCVSSCYSGALVRCGNTWSIDKTVDRLLEDQVYYNNSGGGVTISGGEPLLQPIFLLGLCRKLKEKDVHIVLQTAASTHLSATEKEIFSIVDHAMIDYKIADPYKNKQITGQKNNLMKDHIQFLLKQPCNIEIRTPLIPNITDTEDNIASIAHFIKSLPKKISYTLLPYHPLGIPKYKQFNLPNTYNNIHHYNTEKFHALEALKDSILEI